MNETLTPLQHQVLSLLIEQSNEKKSFSVHAMIDKMGIGVFGRGAPKAGIVNAINVLRFAGYPICSSSNGYFYARDPESLRKFIARLQTRIDPTLKLIEALHECYSNVGTPGAGAKLTVGRYVRTPDGVALKQFEIGEDGQPIIPTDVELV